MKIAGTIYNELRLFPLGAETFRRTAVSRTRHEIEQSGIELAREARGMVDPAVRIMPRFARHVCSPCAYQLPCIATTEGRDVTSVLRAAYFRPRRREPPTSTGVGRGATLPPTRPGRE